MTIDIHKVITGNPITKNYQNHGDRIKKKLYLINIQDREILLKNKLIFILIQVKYIKLMILLHQIMIDVLCFMI